MKITQDIGIRICGTGSSVPERKISNDDMATIVETNENGSAPAPAFPTGILRTRKRIFLWAWKPQKRHWKWLASLKKKSA